ncbi:MAG: pseudouridine synthase [Fuerstiella sp.]|nr:pseudouridine synthase [Fuerstiella sp.]
MNDRLPILYCDDQYVAIAKPAGMFVHRTNMDRRVRDVVVQTARDQLGRPVFPVHRLDRPTSGIVLMGLSTEAASAASELFRERRVGKSYLALVRGHAPDEGRIDRPLTSPETVYGEPLEAVTEFKTECRFEVPLRSGRFPTTRCSLIRALPRTGRFHQIRRHLNGINHPIIGDTSHGDSRQNRFFRTYANAVRLMLHAAEIRFCHPATNECVEIQCPMPDDMSEPLKRLTD